jgi:hypothetical protein
LVSRPLQVDIHSLILYLLPTIPTNYEIFRLPDHRTVYFHRITC